MYSDRFNIFVKILNVLKYGFIKQPEFYKINKTQTIQKKNYTITYD